MTDHFTNKSGNDANGGLSAADAFLSIQAGLDSMAQNNDRLFIGAGVYNESPSRSWAFGQPIPSAEIFGDGEYGQTVLDGQGVLTDGLSVGGVGAGANRGTVFVFGLVAKDYLGAGFRDNSVTEGRTDFFRCRAFDCNFGFQGAVRGRFFDSLSHDNVRGISVGGLMVVERCTIFNNAIGMTTNIGAMRNCLFLDNTRHVEFSGTPSTVNNWNFNLYFPVGVSNDLRSADLTVHTTLASWQGSAGTPDLDSVNVDPLVNDKAKKMLRPSLTSTVPTIMAGVPASTVNHVGWESNPTKGVSNSADLANWDTNAIKTDITKDGSGNYELTTPPDGDLKTGVIDYGTSRTLTRLTIESVINYPLEVLDFDNTDVEPNKPSMRYRVSDTVFLPGAGAPAFVEVAIGETIVGAAGRFHQYEVFFRNDGVAA